MAACGFVSLNATRASHVAAQTSATQTPPAPTPTAVERGRLIYHEGQDGTRDEITALLGGEELEAPATAFACVSCHSAGGEGASEGGIRPPPITWNVLTNEGRSALTGRTRAPYDEAALARAIIRGVDPRGVPLHAAMPHYRMTERQTSDLIAFLKILGTDADADPGLSPQTILVGASLPLSGSLAPVGEAVRATMNAYFEQLNARGGVYGRRIELVFEDSSGTPAGTLEATRKLVEVKRVFALVGSFEPSGDEATGEYLRRQSVPLIGPPTLTPRLSVPPNPSVFYLLPTLRDQARALAQFVRDESMRGAGRAQGGGAARLFVVSSDDAEDREAAEGAKLQAQTQGMTHVTSRTYRRGEFAAEAFAAEASSAKADYVLFFGGPAEFTQFARALDASGQQPVLAGLALTLGRAALELSPTTAARTYLAHPTPLPEPAAFAEFAALIRGVNAGRGQLAFQAIAFASAKTFTEALKMSGQRLRRTTLVAALEQLNGFETGVLPPQTFNLNRRIGPTGAYIVRPDPERKQFTPLSGWLSVGAEK